MYLLKGYTPILAGTIPLGIDIADSDLDVLCYWKDKNTFINTLESSFSGMEKFCLKDYSIDNILTVKANFFLDGIEVEIFGQNIPVKEQYGYRHMVIEHRILGQHGDDFLKAIIRLKQQGLKTEPAFAKLLGLAGDPYKELLHYKMG